MIPDDVLEEVRERADLVEVIGEHVPLKRAGKDFRGLCPFHKEKTPSFYVVPAKGFYKCFGCGESGDVFSFLMKQLGLGFNESVEQLARRVGVELPRAEASPEQDALAPLREAVAYAADYYQRLLWDDARAAGARAYLEKRGVSRAAAERFLLGYAPDEWRALRDAAAQHGMADEVLEAAGLVKSSERAGEPYDRLRDRLVFPITDAAGRAIAFGGRILSGGSYAPKYLNSPETPLYHKGRVLYGLAWAKHAIRREEAALVVEGYMDYVSLAAREIENVVATLGTSMTEEQATLLARYTRQALVLYDSDTAGLRATFRSGDALLRAGVHALVVTLPSGEDPDSVVRSGGAAALRPYLDDAVDVLERKMQILDERAYFEDVDEIRKALDGLLPTLRAATDPALRDIYVDRVAKRTGVRRETLQREIAAPARSAGPRAEAAKPQPQQRTVGAAPERILLLLLARDPGRIPQARGVVAPDELRDPVHRELLEGLYALPERADGAVELSGFRGGAEAVALLEQLRGSPDELGEADEMFAAAVERIRLRPVEERIAELTRRIALAPADEESRLYEELNGLQRELKQRSAQLGRLGGGAWTGFARRHRRG